MSNLPVWFSFVLPLVLLWSVFWKGLALWHSARRGQAAWFVVMLVVNTAGLLEIFYLYKSGTFKPGKLFSK